MLKKMYLAVVLAAWAGPGYAQSSDAEAAVKGLMAAFQQAERNYDVGALSQLLDTRFVESSPAGELDAHDRFLGFYTPDKKVDWPPVSVSEEHIRVFGDTALDTLKLTYMITAPDGTVVNRDVRAVFAAQRTGGGQWKLLGTQFTGIRATPSAK